MSLAVQAILLAATLTTAYTTLPRTRMLRIISKHLPSRFPSIRRPRIPFLPRWGTRGLGMERVTDEKPKILVISGPTAVGKSRIAEELCRLCDGEIISADSVQVYRRMDIGSAKPTQEIMAEIPHHLVNSRDPAEEYNAAIFAVEAHEAISDVLSRGRLPIVVGGTGFYIEWLIYGKPEAPAPTPEASSRAQREIDRYREEEKGWDMAIAQLRTFDPETASRLGCVPNHWYRLKRALEVYYTEGKPLSHYERPNGKGMTASQLQAFLDNCPYDYRCYFLTRPRDELFRAIDARCEEMVADGLVRTLDLITNLTKKEGSLDDKLVDYLHVFAAASRQFAQRQLKQFRREPLFQWVRYSNTLSKRLQMELAMSREEYEVKRKGDALGENKEETGRFPSPEEQKAMERKMKEYAQKLSIFADSKARENVIRDALDAKD
ncbi:hypothetical protein AAMO2058_001052000 [Amorphochlora amoebiformis]